MRLCIALQPLLILATDSSCGFLENEKTDLSPWMHFKSNRGVNGGIPDSYLRAKSGRALIDAHIDLVLNNPHMFVYFDYNGKLQRLPEGQWVSFSELESRGLGPHNILNYRQAQSEHWQHTVNISPILTTQGTIDGHRAELCCVSTGLQHQRNSTVLLTHLMAYNDTFVEKITALLRNDFGIDVTKLEECRAVLDSDFAAAAHHGGRFHDLPFGRKTMKDIALKLADMIEEAFDSPDIAAYARPLVHILRSGRPDWLVYREAFTTLEDVKTYMKEFSMRVEDNPCLISSKSCADFYFSKIEPCLAA